MYKKLVIFFIITLVTVLAFFLIKKSSNQSVNLQRAQEISEECIGVGRKKCLSEKIVSYISTFPENTGSLLDSFEHLLKYKIITDETNSFFEIVHSSGMKLINNDIPLSQAMVYCGESFKQGCIHGAVMEYIDNTYPSDIDSKSLFMMCSNESSNFIIYLNCLHGIGHELAAKEKGRIIDIIHLCDPLQYTSEAEACGSGVLMEYSKGQAGLGRHSELSPWKIELPCLDINDRYKSICSTMQQEERNK